MPDFPDSGFSDSSFCTNLTLLVELHDIVRVSRHTLLRANLKILRLTILFIPPA